MKILFITSSDIGEGPGNGGSMVSRRNLRLLKNLPGCEVTVSVFVREAPQEPVSGVWYLSAASSRMMVVLLTLLGYSGYASPVGEAQLVKHLREVSFDFVFLDSSSLGRVARTIRRRSPSTRILTFFHNVEYLYARSKVSAQGLAFLPSVWASFVNERLAVDWSDQMVAINPRDRDNIATLYGRKPEAILPVSFPSAPSPLRGALRTPLEVLFLGSSFHANLHGLSWFIERVLPEAEIRLTVAGKGMDQVAWLKNAGTKIRVLGELDDVSRAYRECDCVVAPILLGSGMKVKTGEAFRFGRTVVGTPEAFEGYDISEGLEGYSCTTPEEFIRAIQTLKTVQSDRHNEEARLYFQEHLSDAKALQTLRPLILQEGTL